jgi:hypothetical protein
MKTYARLLCLLCLAACQPAGEDLVKAFVDHFEVDGRTIQSGKLANSIDPASLEITVVFSSPVNLSKMNGDKLYLNGYDGKLSIVAGPTEESVVVKPESPLEHFRRYSLVLEKGANLGVRLIDDYSLNIVTSYDPSDKFPRIPDDELLTLVQRQTFKYFWDYAHPVSGLARERLGSGETVTTGGSGFGIMCLPVAVERGFISRTEAAERLRTITGFLKDKAVRYHGAFPHWLNGTSGATIPFSANDNGGDLIETAFLIQGLLAAAGYFDRPEEADIREDIDAIWRDVEWDWYTRGGQDVLYWHWSPDKGWAMNMQINGWNEGLIAYVLAAASPTHPVKASVYHNGWTRGGGIRNGRKFYDITLPLGSDLGGPMFFAHYSFLGLDPRGLKDQYADYWEQNVAHARINHAYCAANPKHHAGYSATCWGLTASDISGGYTASSPTNDRGTIAPTAALASMPYTPAESFDAMRSFYYTYGDRLWSDYGFRDAFCLDAAWFAGSYIAIDQGPIVVMIENYRSGLLWDCFMKHPDVAAGLSALGFSR